MSKHIVSGFLFFVCIAMSPLVQADEVAVPAKGDTEIKLLSGSKFTAPNGWLVQKAEGRADLQAPEKDLTITFLERPLSGKAIDVLASIWKEIKPGFQLPEYQRTSPPAKDGWEEVHQIIYDTPAKEARVVLALIRVFKGRGYINLVDGTSAGLSRRGAQLGIALESWKPEGLSAPKLGGRTAKVWTKAETKEFESFVQQAMSDLKIPGTAIAIVQNGKLAYKGSFGVKSVESREPVSTNTLFMIGSTTKPLTTLMMAKLIELKKFSWSTPVSKVLPTFKLAEPAVTAKVQMQHTACACTGMPRQDLGFIFEYDGVTAEQRIEQMNGMKPTTGFGETFQYSNFLVSAGGYAAARAYDPKSSLEQAYASAMKSLVFDPLQMENTVIKIADARKKDSAFPHARNLKGEIETIPDRIEEAVGSVAPAGALWSNVDDLSRYVQMELAKGVRADGKRVYSEASLLARRKPGVRISESSSYGLGLFLEDEQGLRIIGHGGNTLGFSSDLYFFPEKGVGVVVLANAAGANGFLSIVKQKFLEVTFGAEPRAAKIVEFAVQKRKESQAKLLERVSVDPKKTAWLESLIGDYSNAELGALKIYKDGGNYIADVGEWKSQIGSGTDVSGERLMTLVSPPWAGGFDFMISGRDLVLDDGQSKYNFKRQ